MNGNRESVKPRPRLEPLVDDLKFDNLWESEEAREAVLDWVRHPGYRYFTRRCRLAEVQQLRTALSAGSAQEFEAGTFKGMVLVRRLAELMASEADIKTRKDFVIPDTDPDELHAHLLREMIEWESRHREVES